MTATEQNWFKLKNRKIASTTESDEEEVSKKESILTVLNCSLGTYVHQKDV